MLAASPFIFVMVLRNTAADYMEPMLITFTGQALMLLVLGMQLLGACFSKSFMTGRLKGQSFCCSRFPAGSGFKSKSRTDFGRVMVFGGRSLFKERRKAAEKNKFSFTVKVLGKRKTTGFPPGNSYGRAEKSVRSVFFPDIESDGRGGGSRLFSQTASGKSEAGEPEAADAFGGECSLCTAPVSYRAAFLGSP